MRDIPSVVVQIAQYIIEANFYVSVVVMILGSAFSLSENYGIFEFNVDIYGEIANNLRAIMAYLAFTEIMIFVLCFFTKQYQYYIVVGFFLMMMIGSLAVYGQINNMDTDPNLDLCFLYVGISHMLFGATAVYKNKNSAAISEKQR